MSFLTYDEKRQIFEQHFLFGNLSADEIDSMIRYTCVEQYPAGRQIFDKGSPGHSVMAVLRGSIKIGSLSSDGKEVVFRIINAGEIFGVIAALDGEPRSADATAITDSELLVLNRRDFLRILENRANLCMILLRILCRRLRQTSEQVEDVMFRHLKSRVAKTLLQLTEGVGLRGLQSKSVELHVSQRELGYMAGGSRERVNQILQNWHRHGLVDLGKASILVHNIDALRRVI
jgi:CRP-like cAMP-binding protein